jgi:o-succinylbenzoate synthase
MRPRTLQLYRIRGEVAGLAGAAAAQTQRAGLLVRVEDDAGSYGQGEASPLPGYSRDTIDDCATQLRAVDLSAISPRQGGSAIDWVLDALDRVGLQAPAARFALETALLDWLGRQRGLGIAALLGAADAAMRIPLAALVGDLASARAAHARGIHTFKIKIKPGTLADSLELAQSLRDEFGNEITLRFDANGTLRPAAAEAQLRQLVRCAPEFVEEPVPLDDLLRMAAAPVPLAADESLAVPGAWPALASVCRVVVLKPTVLGGLAVCMRVAREAAARGLAVTVTHTFDGPVALAAAAELAVALAAPLACGLDRHAALGVWPSVAIPQIGASSIVSANRPGLGLADIRSE